MWKCFEKWPFFRADMAGLGKYSMGRDGRIGVHRVNNQLKLYKLCKNWCVPTYYEYYQ